MDQCSSPSLTTFDASDGAANPPSAGYLRQAELIGRRAVSAEEAARNRNTGKTPVRPRAAVKGIVPFSHATLWRKVRNKEFPAPARLSAGIVAWRLQDVLNWLASKSS